MKDQQEKVIAAIRATLPEFAQRNGITLSEETMDNLANWTAGVIPWLIYRHPCGVNLDGIPCACTGACQTWRSIDVEDFYAQSEADPIERESGPAGGTWISSGSADDFTVKS